MIAIWDKTRLLGLSVIETILEEDATKVRRRCPQCTKTGFKERETLTPRFRCPACKSEFDQPNDETLEVHTYRTIHGASWTELPSKLDAATLRTLCLEPESQHSLRELDWELFRARVAEVDSFSSLSVVEHVRKQIAGGHKAVVARSRIGQGQFRSALVQRFGNVCAVTGPHPLSTLDAAHLYSYAEHEKHDVYGGLLLRKDIHRLLDLGLLCVEPETLAVDLHPDLHGFPGYAIHHTRQLVLDLPVQTRSWLRVHWSMHRTSTSATVPRA